MGMRFPIPGEHMGLEDRCSGNKHKYYFKKKSQFYLSYMLILLLHVLHICICSYVCLVSLSRYPGTRYEWLQTTMWCWEVNSVPLQELVLLTAEQSSLQLPNPGSLGKAQDQPNVLTEELGQVVLDCKVQGCMVPLEFQALEVQEAHEDLEPHGAHGVLVALKDLLGPVKKEKGKEKTKITKNTQTV